GRGPLFAGLVRRGRVRCVSRGGQQGTGRHGRGQSHRAHAGLPPWAPRTTLGEGAQREAFTTSCIPKCEGICASAPGPRGGWSRSGTQKDRKLLEAVDDQSCLGPELL